MAEQEMNEAPAAAENTGTQGHMIPKTRFDEVNTELKRLRSEMERLGVERQAAEEKRLAEQQEWQKLAEARAARIAELEPLAQRVKEAQEALAATVKARVDRLPEDVRDMVPDFGDARKTLEWLDANEGRLLKPIAPGTDAGVRGDSASKVTLSPSQQAAARAAHLTDAQYIEALLKSRPKE